MAQYYTLEEAAKILQTTPDKLRELVRQGKLRGFQDKGTLRFRAHEIDEMARAQGLGSDPELKLGETPEKKPGSSSSGSGKRKQPVTPNLSLDDNDEDDDKKKPRKPTMVKPPVASDSDVRLVVEDFDLDEEPAPSSSGSRSGDKKQAKPDSALRLLPLDEDSDVKLVPDEDEENAIPTSSTGSSRRNAGSKRPSDSDIRLDADDGSDPQYDPLVTEEIDLDAEELRNAQPRKKSELKQPQKKSELKQPQKKSELKQPQKKSELKQPQKRSGNSGTNLPTSSPFELSEDDINLDADPSASGASGKSSGGKKKSGPSSSARKKAAPLNMSLDDDAPLSVPADDSDAEIGLGLELRDDAGVSGTNLADPADSGPSLEDNDGSSDMELSLSLDDDSSSSSSRSSKSSAGKKKVEEEPGSSEFELTLDEGDESGVDSSSEFELTLDDDNPAASGAESGGDSSEFELTLDDDDGGVNLAPIDEEADEKDIFETNLDVPALEDESGSEAMPLESTPGFDESSEFELDLESEGEGDEDGESGSQVVPLDDDEDVDEAADTAAARTAARRRGKARDDDEEEAAEEEDVDVDIDEDVEPDEDEEERPAATVPAEAAPWGVFPVLMLMPTAIVLFVVGLMAFEMVRGMWGYHRQTKMSEMILRPIAEMVDKDLPK